MKDDKRFKREYRKRWWCGAWRHSYRVIARHVVIEFHFTEKDFGGGMTGGVETHYRQPPSYMADEAPHYQHCPFTEGLCWHDGSSMAADELIQQHMERCEDLVWSMLEARALSHSEEWTKQDD